MYQYSTAARHELRLARMDVQPRLLGRSKEAQHSAVSYEIGNVLHILSLSGS